MRGYSLGSSERSYSRGYGRGVCPGRVLLRYSNLALNFLPSTCLSPARFTFPFPGAAMTPPCFFQGLCLFPLTDSVLSARITTKVAVSPPLAPLTTLRETKDRQDLIRRSLSNQMQWAASAQVAHLWAHVMISTGSPPVSSPGGCDPLSSHSPSSSSPAF